MRKPETTRQQGESPRYWILEAIKNNIKRHFRIPPEHIGYIHYGVIPEYRCPAEDCGFGVSDDWICCPYCGQRFGEFKENPDVAFAVMKFDEEVADAIREDITGD